MCPVLQREVLPLHGSSSTRTPRFCRYIFPEDTTYYTTTSVTLIILLGLKELFTELWKRLNKVHAFT